MLSVSSVASQTAALEHTDLAPFLALSHSLFSETANWMQTGHSSFIVLQQWNKNSVLI